MTSPSILGMNQTVALLEQLAEDRDKSQPGAGRYEEHYWHIQRKAKRGKRWIFHLEFFGSKAQVADYWRDHFRGKGKGYRLVHVEKISR